MFPAIHLVVLLEEPELRERFGAEYEEYCGRVPRYIPKRQGSLRLAR
jgi:protein-S-isoprenylcysteine O-methyltransferase Ste14